MTLPGNKGQRTGLPFLGMDDNLQYQMGIYVKMIRPQFTQPGEQKLFIKDDGAGFHEGTIGKQVSAFFEKSGVTKTRIAHTHLQKFISTQTYEHGNPKESQEVEKVMSHGKTTRKRCYVRKDCTRTTSQAMAIIARVVKPVATQEFDNHESQHGTPLATEQSDNSKESKEKKGHDGNENNENQEVVESGHDIQSDSTGIIPATPQRKEQKSILSAMSNEPPKATTADVTHPSVSPDAKLTDKEKKAADTVFENELTSGMLLTMAYVQNKMRTNFLLRKKAVFRQSVKKFVNYLNYQIGKARPKEPPSTQMSSSEKTDLWLYDSDHESSMQSGHHQSWDERDTSVIEHHFKQYISCPTKDKIKRIFNAEEDLYEIMHREPFSRCYEKVKNVIKKNAKNR